MVVMIGRLGNDPVMSSDKTARFTIVSHDGEQARFTQCAVAAKQAELVMQHVKKGTLICIEGNWGASEKKILVARKVTFLSSVSK
mgnify:CR=1 FL=1